MRIGLKILVVAACGLAAASAAQNPASSDVMERQKAELDKQAAQLKAWNITLGSLGSDLTEWRDAFAAGQADQARVAADMLAQGYGTRDAFVYSNGSRYGSDLRQLSYEVGQMALDRRRWDEAAQIFGQIAAKGDPRADGALYWKAYALNKLGRRDEALAALAELRKAHSGSRWLDDAKALELEVKQAAGKPVSADAESDEDLKIQVLNGLWQQDPDRTLPALEQILKSAQSPKLKERALFVLAQSNSPKARQALEQIARGSGNPDLQVKAITYLSAVRRPQGGNAGQLLSEIYASSNDVIVKRAVLNALENSGDSDRLLQIMKSEKSEDLKIRALNNYLAMRRSQDRRAIFGGQKPPTSGDITALYADQGPEAKRAIVNWLASEGDAKAVVGLARSERDRDLVRFIIGRLANMKSPEAADYLMEVLKSK